MEMQSKEDPVSTDSVHGEHCSSPAEVSQPCDVNPPASRKPIDLEARNEALKAELERKTTDLLRTAANLRQLTDSVRSYQNSLDHALRVYSQQRAWRLMVAIRRAYKLWTNSTLLGKFNAFVTLLLNPFPKEGEYPEYELDIPRPENAMSLPDTSPDSSRSWSQSAPSSGTRARRPFQRKYDVVVFAIIDYDFRFQRPQQIAAEFARRGHRVFWVSPTRFLPAGSQDAYTATQVRHNIWEIHLRGQQVDIYRDELSDSHCASFKISLETLFRNWAVSECVTVVQLPFWRKLANSLRRHAPLVTAYDCMDDWEHFENIGNFNRQEEQLLIQEVDALFVSAEKLRDEFKSISPGPVLVRNGVDYEYFTRGPYLDKVTNIPKPIVGYYGAIADWMDLDLAYHVATLRPQYSFVFIGKVFDRNVSRLASLPNVHLIGHQPYDAIPSYLAQFDVCHIPFLLNEVTAATDPVKLYEYLSLGKPVVATPMGELRHCEGLVEVASTPEEYVAAVDRSLQPQSREEVESRQDFAHRNTWRARVDLMDEKISNVFPRISVIIVTYNSGLYINHCIESIYRNNSYPDIEIIIVDNNSKDDTIDIVNAHANRWNRIKSININENKGFAAANNIGVGSSSGEYVILLNADTVVTPGWCGRLLRTYLQNSMNGLVTAVTNFAANEVKIPFEYIDRETMEEFSVCLGVKEHYKSIVIDTAPLFCSLIPKKLYTDISGLDEIFDIGMFEDDDFSMRIRQRGFQICTAEDCFVHHFGQGSFSQLPNDEYERVFAANKNRFEKKWRRGWIPHKRRPGVKAAREDVRFAPETFFGVEANDNRPGLKGTAD